ncbi:hypothetical protein COO60DRAFT_1512068 [Scenedesmus sp. NREL 46B-D3]|nr:hypothetical protein COO60DRAFT_1512068 [Scenedesmus sp. NREL 46B-D3]
MAPPVPTSAPAVLRATALLACCGHCWCCLHTQGVGSGRILRVPAPAEGEAAGSGSNRTAVAAAASLAWCQHQQRVRQQAQHSKEQQVEQPGALKQLEGAQQASHHRPGSTCCLAADLLQHCQSLLCSVKVHMQISGHLDVGQLLLQLLTDAWW